MLFLVHDEQVKLVRAPSASSLRDWSVAGERARLQERKRRRSSALKKSERLDVVKPRSGWPLGVRECAQTWKRVSCLAWKVTVRSFLWERTLRARLRVEVETGAD